MVKRTFDRFVHKCFTVATRSINNELARRNATRGTETFRWFTPEEAVAAEALARIIVPSDEATPGIDEIGVLDAPAMVTLDKLVAASPDRQYLYSRGLLSFDVWARHERNCGFAEMAKDDQIAFFRAAQRTYERSEHPASRIGRVWGRLREIVEARQGRLFAAQLYPRIREDCLRLFYTSRVSWTWLEYDGPPMDKGYPNVLAPRER